ncbi:hypothetical protein VP01_472g1, partial [Puccinia sorghi]
MSTRKRKRTGRRFKKILASHNQIQSYLFLHSAYNAVQDPLNEDSIIAIIKLTPFEKLTPSEKDDLNFIPTFLYNSKQLISPVVTNLTTRTKSLDDTSGSFGLKTRLHEILTIASPLGLVRLLVTFVKKVAHENFKKNQNLMEKYKLPSFSDLSR